jgi:hypothetical protein
MTLIVTGMIGEYAFIAANRNRNYVYDMEKKCMVLTPLTKKESKILIVNDVVLVGSCNVVLLKKYNKYFLSIAKKNPEDLKKYEKHLDYFGDNSNFDRVNYYIMFRSKTNKIYQNLYCQTDDLSHEAHQLQLVKGDDYGFYIVPPFDLDGQEVFDRLDYLFSIMPDKSLHFITNALKQLYTECSDVSPFVTSGFHLAVMHKKEQDIFTFIDN